MSDPSVGAVIVNHIDELESALRYADTTMEPMLGKAVATVLDDKRLTLGWTGDLPSDLKVNQWLAPEEWRIAGDDDEAEFYLYFALDTVPCIDGQEPRTWIGTLAGFAGAGIRLSAKNDALGARAWKALLKSQSEILDELVRKGFICDPKNGEVAFSVHISRESLAAGFDDEALETALEPLAVAVGRIDAARPILDRLVEAIKRTAAE